MTLNLEEQLNPSQLEAVKATEGPVLVIAGAGSGKTRTIVYRLAHLARQGVPPESILLLTFTRKASQAMLNRAGRLMKGSLHGVTGGTFHSFAFGVLRRYAAALGYPGGFTIMDRTDAEDVLKQVRDRAGLGKGDRSFPKKSTVMSLISKSRNKELDLETLLERESFHLLPHLEDLRSLTRLYAEFKHEHSLMDYDDLLFHLERLLTTNPDLADFLRLRYRYLMVDEYQDTNLVQGRLVKLLAGENGNVMAVGDDAQSIYAFRGATVHNILGFTRSFPKARVIKLEQNYRSTQPILDLTNQILAQARDKYDKHLFSESTTGGLPCVVRPLSDMTQARLVVDRVAELSASLPLSEIAVLFRAGYQSYPVEVALNKAGLPFRKYGGIRFSEAAHIKDVLAHLRLVVNPGDLPAWHRAVGLIQGVGPKTAERLYASLMGRTDPSYALKARTRFPALGLLLGLLDTLRTAPGKPMDALEEILEHYQPVLEERYPDDYPKRQAGLEQLLQIASSYSDTDTFLADMSLEEPEGRHGGEDVDSLVLSTVHSAKGLEWTAVLVIDLVEERFPSRHALASQDDLEEERRLLYVACTRAREHLSLFVPDSVYNRYNDRSDATVPSPFLQGLNPDTFEEWREGYTGNMTRRTPLAAKGDERTEPPPQPEAQRLGHCFHKIFGRGKLVAFLPPNKYRVNFPGFGLKVIIGDYLQMEE